MKKRVLYLLGGLLFFFSFAAALSGKNVEAATCYNHSATNSKVTKAATCTSSGTREYRCKNCGYLVKTETIKATGHSYGSVITVKSPTCTEAGSGYKDCTICSHREAVTLNKTSHNPVAFTNNATCTSTGSKGTKCSKCGNIIGNVTTIDKLPHSYGSKVTTTTAATCTSTGIGYQQCSCGAKKTVTIDKKSHSPEAFEEIATCTKQGRKGIRCSVCKTVLGDVTYTAKKDHSYGSVTVEKNATCTEYGSGYKTCSVCKHQEAVTIKPTGHDGAPFENDSTCAKEGSKGSKCKKCDAILGDVIVIAKKEHTWGGWVCDHKETETLWGEYHRHCKVCGEADVLMVEPTGNASVTGTPSITDTPSVTGTPDSCKNGHTWGTWIVDKPSKCEEKGTRHHVCKVCNKSEVETTDVLGHQKEKYHHEASCKDEYYVERCSVCYKELGSREYVPVSSQRHYSEYIKTREEEIEDTSIDAVIVYDVTYCSYCDYVISKEYNRQKSKNVIPLDDTCSHKWNDWICDHKENETEYGQYHRTCSKCGKLDTKLVDPTGSADEKQKNCSHSWGSWICDHKETTTEYGQYHRTCSKCNKIEYKTEKPRAAACLNGHNWGSWIVVKKPDCAAKGYRYRKCNNSGCGEVDIEHTDIDPRNHSPYSTFIKQEVAYEDLRQYGINLPGDRLVIHDVTCCEGCGVELSRTINQECLESYRNNQAEAEEAIIKDFGGESGGGSDNGKSDDGKSDTGKTNDKTCINGHNWGAWVERTVATCKSQGVEQRTCRSEGCGATEYRYTPAVSHKYSSVRVGTTCTELGYTVDRCVFCGKEKNKKKDTTLADHTYGTWICDHKENCLQMGSYHRVCSVCGKTDYKKVKAKGHVAKSKLRTVKSTCSKQGYTVKVCKECGCEFGDKTYLPLAEHAYSRKIVVSPTCNNTGYAVYKCDNCSKTVGRVTLAKLTHNIESWSVERQPDYDNEGVEKGVCTLCQTVFRRSIAKLQKNDKDKFKVAGFSIAPVIKGTVLFDEDGYCLDTWTKELMLSVYSNVDWDLNTGSSFAHIYVNGKDCGSSYSHKGSDTVYLTIKLDPMKTKLERSCTAVFTYMDKGKQATTSFTLSQRRANSTVTSTNVEYIFDKNGKCTNVSGKGSATLNIKSAVGWKVTVKDGSKSPSWVQLSYGDSVKTKSFTGEGSAQLSISVSPTNEVGVSRSATITVKCDGGEEFTFSVVQKFDHEHEYEQKKAANGGIKKRCKVSGCSENKWKVYYPLTFDLDGGKGSIEKEVIVSAEDGVDYKMPVQEPTKKGYDFIGWMPDGNSDMMLYPGEGFTICAKHTFKAAWGCKNAVRVQMQAEYGSTYLPDSLFLDDYQSSGWLPLGPGNTYYILKTTKVSDYHYTTKAYVLSYGTRSVMMDDGSYQMVDRDVLILKEYHEFDGVCKYFESLIYLTGHNDDITASMAMLETADSLFSFALGGFGVGGKVICASKDIFYFIKNFDYEDAQTYLDIVDSYNIDVINKSYEFVCKGNVPVGDILSWFRKMGDLYKEHKRAELENLDPNGDQDLPLDYFRRRIRDAGFPDSIADTGLKDTVNKIYKLKK